MEGMAHLLGGDVVAEGKREYGPATVEIRDRAGIFEGLSAQERAWVSHGDTVRRPPEGFSVVASTTSVPVAAMTDGHSRYAVQFHPEVAHTPHGAEILRNFLYRVCGATGDWTPASFVEEAVRELRERIGDRHAICALSGGVDSAVAAALVQRAVGDRLTCIYVDHGLMRKKESELLRAVFEANLGMRLVMVDAAARFLRRLAGVADPEEKRRIVVDEIKAAGLYRSVWQSFAILTPVRSVGVMGDGRTYANVVAIRAVTSEDGMTADWAKLPYDVLAKISSRIVNEVPGVNRVVYDISSKPPATIEWE